METLLLGSSDVHSNTPMRELIDAIEEAFVAYEEGRVQMPAKSYLELDRYNGDFRSMPAYIDAEDWDAAGIKWVNVHPDNPKNHDLPTVMGLMIYSDPQTAFPLAIMDGTELTLKRTGAAAAVATDHLAIDNASTLGIIGTGIQSYTQVEGVTHVRNIEEIVVHDVDEAQVAAFIKEFEDEYAVREGSIEEAGHCDVLSTVTPVRNPIVHPRDVGGHTHINAVGADANGKQELSDDLLVDSKIVIDDYEQTIHSGEINVPYEAGVVDESDIHGEIGQVVTREITGRTDTDCVTVFDSTGLAIQDVAAAHIVYRHANERDTGITTHIVDA